MSEAEKQFLREEQARETPWMLTGQTVAQWLAEQDHLFPKRLHFHEPYRRFGMKSPPPPDSGVYFLLAGDSLLYVGKAAHLFYRIGTHADQGRIPFTHACWLPCLHAAAHWVEAWWIGSERPAYNRLFDCRMERMADAVNAALMAAGKD